MLSLQEKIEIVLICGENTTHRNAANIFNARHPDKHICQSTVSRIMTKFKQTGSVENSFKKGHKKWITKNEDKCLNVLLDATENKITSLSKISDRTDVSTSSVYRILKNNDFRPYKPKFISTLKERDFDPRFDFSAWFQGQIEENFNFPKHILWTDEATFTSNGIVSSQNCRWWSFENPNFVIECRDQYSFKTNVLCGIVNNYLLGPFCFRENLKSGQYLEFLNTELTDFLDELPLNIRENLWFQLDGAPIHSTVAIRDFLNQKFNGRWIGRLSNHRWPARSPDLTPLDFFFWGYLKQKVYAERPFRNVDELENTIREKAMQVPAEFLVNAVKDVSRRTMLCMEQEGRHTEM